MKKLLLALGSIAAVAAPVASVVACGAPAKPAPKAIDNTAATKLAAKIAKGLGSTVDPVVTPLANGNFEFTFDITHGAKTDHADITITPTGEVVAAKMGAVKMTGADLESIKTQVKAATENHDNDSTDKTDFDASTLDDDIVKALLPLTPPADITETDYDSVNTYNDAVTAFNKAYKEEIAQELLASLVKGVVLTKTQDEIKTLGYSDVELTDARIDAIGISGPVATTLKHLISLGGVTKVTITNNGDVSGSVLGLADSADSSWSWITKSTATAADVKNTVQFSDYTA